MAYAISRRFRALSFTNLGWGDAEAATLLEALRYAAEHCTFPRGKVKVSINIGNTITKEDRRAEWAALESAGKFYYY